MESLFHPLESTISTDNIRLNNPFEYLPHPLVIEASRELLDYVEGLKASNPAIEAELSQGKMLGVLVVRNSAGELGYLSGFSGCIAGELTLDNFVPPITGREITRPDFVQRETEISALSKEIEAEESNTELIEAERLFKEIYEKYRVERQQQDDKRILRTLKNELRAAKMNFFALQKRVSELRETRRNKSNALQRDMFESYSVINGQGEWQTLLEIFELHHHRLPPSGAGECAAPKMLHYALCNNLTPIALGEFWHGESPRGEIRHEGHFYGACSGKCLPILNFMLQGIEVAPIAPELRRSAREPLEVLFEDEYLALLNKPAGMLSVDGKSNEESVQSIVRKLYPKATGSMMVHRLDQETSGLILIAKNPEIHTQLQRQFAKREMQKRYTAIVEGEIKEDSGEIRLPMMVNHLDRPRQMVNHKYGKAAHTTYEVIERGDDYTRLALYPHTGRTHQLRLHCAHPEGLNAPIKGDRLYGEYKEGERMYLHAESIEFEHPVTLEKITYQVDPNF